MNAEQVRQWVLEHPLSPAHVDCATAVMLKILDGKCKMDAEEKIVMALLYDAVKGCPGMILGEDIHALIETARHSHEDDEIREFVYEKRVLAETMISRPVMKGFKGMIRAEGLFVANNCLDPCDHNLYKFGKLHRARQVLSRLITRRELSHEHS